MRPQHITAENAQSERLQLRDRLASMRPQHITAENSRRSAGAISARRCFNEAAAYHCGKRAPFLMADRPEPASMRPQHITAENAGRGRRAGARSGQASMRPQHITAENSSWRSRWRRPAGGFNEAAAYHCGKRPSRSSGAPEPRAASMRPQHITAENPGRTAAHRPNPPRFNEAAAYHCGKRGLRILHADNAVGFNEAAAYHCGKQVTVRGSMMTEGGASMRPQHITAENEQPGRGRSAGRTASMRPQHITAENFRACSRSGCARRPLQ